MKLQIGDKVQEFVDAITGELVSGTITRLTPNHVFITNDEDPDIGWAYPRPEFEKGANAYWRKEATPNSQQPRHMQPREPDLTVKFYLVPHGYQASFYDSQGGLRLETLRDLSDSKPVTHRVCQIERCILQVLDELRRAK